MRRSWDLSCRAWFPTASWSGYRHFRPTRHKPMQLLAPSRPSWFSPYRHWVGAYSSEPLSPGKLRKRTELVEDKSDRADDHDNARKHAPLIAEIVCGSTTHGCGQVPPHRIVTKIALAHRALQKEYDESGEDAQR